MPNVVPLQRTNLTASRGHPRYRYNAGLVDIGSGTEYSRSTPVALPTGNQLVYFTVTGYWYDTEQQNPNNSSTQPSLLNVSAFVDFFPRLPKGFTLLVPNMYHGDGTVGDTSMPIAPVTGRLLNGSLRSLAVGDPIGVGLLAASPFLNIGAQLAAAGSNANALIYDVRFRNVTFGGAPQAMSNFAFYAPVAATTISITSYGFNYLPYGGP